jgi:hypothetical protein
MYPELGASRGQVRPQLFENGTDMFVFSPFYLDLAGGQEIGSMGCESREDDGRSRLWGG